MSPGVLRPAPAAAALVAASVAIAAEGRPLMRRLLPDGVPMRFWDGYPAGDIVSPSTGARAFYHTHPPGARTIVEHGHFHIFLPRGAMPPGARPLRAPPDQAGLDIVHLVAMSIAPAGLPTGLFTVNRWVTDEWLYPADAIIAALGRFDLCDSPVDPLLGQWLTAAIHLCQAPIAVLLRTRDAALDAGLSGEDRTAEVLSEQPIDLQQMLADAL